MSTLLDLDTVAGSGRSRLLQAVAERDRLERALLALPAALDGSSISRVVELCAEAACELTNARVAITELPTLLTAPVTVGPDRDAIVSRLDLIRAPWIGRADREIPALQVESLRQTAPFGATSDGRELRAVLTFPVRGRHGCDYGVMAIAHHRRSAFSGRHARLARAIAGYLGHAIEVFQLAAEERRISIALQETLLPPLLPAIPGVELCARYRPSGRGNLVGGDFYDIFSNGRGGWGLLVGDASGIGPESAGLAGIARYTARALADSSLGPTAILGHLNRALLRAAPDDRFCTAALLEFTVVGESIDVQIASAGHPPAYRLARDGSVSMAIEATGTLLGVVDEATVAETTLRLEPGDALVLYTDGVTEARDATGVQFGDARLVTALESAVGRSAEGIARRIELAVLDHRGPNDSDDVAVVALRAP